MARVSVHIVTYNSAETIQHCLEGLRTQEDADFSVLLIDNASSDDTLTLAENFDIPIIANTKNLGYAVAHNQAIAETESDYVLTLNPDVWLHPRFLCEMTAHMDQYPAVGSAAGKLLRTEKLGENPATVDSTGLYMRRNRRQGLSHEVISLNTLKFNIR